MPLPPRPHGSEIRETTAIMANTPPNEPEGAGNTPAQPGEGAQSASASGEPTSKHPDDVIAALRAEAAELKDRLLRAHAEVENIRKRSEREKEETAKYAVTRFARDIVNVGDNFQRAIDAVPAGAAERDAALKSFLEGVTMTERELLNVLERYGIKRIQPINEPFNPHLHQAVMELQRTDVPAGTVVQVFQAGFTIEDRVLRPAMVAVAKGGPKPAQGPDGTAGPATPPPATPPPG
jgi:molecular chaperone GrpE